MINLSKALPILEGTTDINEKESEVTNKENRR